MEKPIVRISENILSLIFSILNDETSGEDEQMFWDICETNKELGELMVRIDVYYLLVGGDLKKVSEFIEKNTEVVKSEAASDSTIIRGFSEEYSSERN